MNRAQDLLSSAKFERTRRRVQNHQSDIISHSSTLTCTLFCHIICVFSIDICHLYKMSSQSSMLNFDYNAELKFWTQTYVKFAFSSNHEDVVRRLFERAKNYVNHYNLRSAVFKEVANLKIALTIKRTNAATILCEELDHDIEIIDHFTFAQRLCKNVLIYMSDFDADIKIREELEKTMRKWDDEIDLSKLEFSFSSFSFSLSSSMTLTRLRSSSISISTSRSVFVALFTSYFRALSSLAQFEFNCYFSRISIFNSSLKLLAFRLFSNANEKNFTLVDFIIHFLSRVLQDHRVLFDFSQQVLYYTLANQESFDLLIDENLQNVVQIVRNYDQNFLKINVRD